MVVKKRAPAAGGSRKKVPAVPAAEQVPEPAAASSRTAAGKAPATKSTTGKAVGKKAVRKAVDGKAEAEPAKKAAVKKAAGKKAASKAPAAATAGAAKKAAGKKAVTKEATKEAAKRTATKAAARVAVAKAAGSVPATEAAGKKAAPQAAGRKAAAGGRGAGNVPPGKAGGETRAARKAAAGGIEEKETAVGKVEAEKTEVPVARAGVAPGALAVLPGEDPWTEEEADEARAELLEEVERLRNEIESSEAAVQGLMRDSGDGAGDEADTGAKNITREYEMALAANTRETLTQAQHALQRLEEGTYGLCEVCGRPIGKARMQAFPRATLCLDDKQKQERR